MRNPVLRCVLVASLASAATAYAPLAAACSLECPPTLGVPSTSFLPSNRVSFPVLWADSEPARLETADGEPIAGHRVTRAGAELFEPVAPIAEGTSVVLKYQDCTGLPPEHEYAFIVTAAEQLPLAEGLLAISERGIAWPDNPNLTAAFVRVDYGDPYRGGAGAHLVQHRAKLDGHIVSLFPGPNGDLRIEIPTVCRADVEGFVSGLCLPGLYSAPPGVHTLEVQSTRLGDEVVPPPVRLEVESVCPDDIAFGGGAIGDLDAIDPNATDAGTTDTATTFADVEGDGSTAGELPAARVNGGAGCSMGSGPGGSAATLGAGLVAALAGLVRRRSRAAST